MVLNALFALIVMLAVLTVPLGRSGLSRPCYAVRNTADERHRTAVGEGAQLLAPRPDVRVASPRAGVATADLYLHITLGGSVGSTAASPDDLGSLRMAAQRGACSGPNLPSHRSRIMPDRQAPERISQPARAGR